MSLKWTGGLSCLAMVASGIVAISGSEGISEAFAIVGYVGMVLAIVQWIWICVIEGVTRRLGGGLHFRDESQTSGTRLRTRP